MLTFAIEKGTLLSVGIAILMLFGIIAIFEVPVQMTPDIERRVIAVKTSWPGATPQEIESEIVVEQEQYLRRIPGLLRMTAEATTGSATVDLEFRSESDIQELLIRVNSALSQVADYPENVDPPRLVTNSSSQESFIFLALKSTPPNRYSRAELTSIIEKYIQTPMERVQDVSQLVIFGATRAQVHINVDPVLLASKGISIAQFRNAIRARNSDFSGGDLDSGKRRYIVRTVGRYNNLEEIKNTIIRYDSGSVIRVSDVANVSLAAEEERTVSRIEGQKSVMMGVQRSPGGNVIDILDDVLDTIEDLNSNTLAPLGLQVIKYSDDVRYVSDAIAVVQKNLALGALFACLTLYLFLRSWTPTLLGALGVPICTIASFLGLLIMDRTLNVISLAGVAFAIGMTLDNSIVVLENIYRHRTMGKGSKQAALDGVSEVWTAVLASTLTTIFVFTPIVLIQEEVGQLYSDIAIAISAAIIMSMLVAITIIPSIASRLPASWQRDSKKIAASKFSLALTNIAGAFKQRLNNLLRKLVASKKTSASMVFAILFVCASILLLATPKAEYLPEGEENKLFIYALSPAGYNLQQVTQAGERYGEFMAPRLANNLKKLSASDDKKQSLSLPANSEVPPLDTFLHSVNARGLFSITETVNPEDTDQLKKTAVGKLKQEPGFLVFASRGSLFSDNSGGSRSIQLDVTGDKLEELYAIAGWAYAKSLELLPGAQIRPLPGLSMGQPTIKLIPDWEKAAELGINTPDLGYTIWSLVDGAYLDDYFLEGEKIDIYLYGAPSGVKHPSDIASLPVFTPSGATVPLSAITRLEHTVSVDTVRRVDATRTVTLNIVPPRSIALETAVSIVEEQLLTAFAQEMPNAGNTTLQIGGASDKLAKASEALSGNIIIAVILAYLLMVAIFSHWGFPLIILLTIPLGMSGGILGLWLVNNVAGISVPFDMITMLGAVVLIGTVVNNPILLVDQARRQLALGLSVEASVLEAVSIRLRPIMMSMTTTVVGLSPIVFLAGAGTELYRGLGTVVLFGLFFSTLLTLTFIPALLRLILKPHQADN